VKGDKTVPKHGTTSSNEPNDLHLWRIRRAPRRPDGHHRNRRRLVHPAGSFGRRSLRLGKV